MSSVLLCIPIFFIYSSIVRYCFHILAIVNNDAMNKGLHIYFQIKVFVFFGKYLEVKFYMALLFFFRNFNIFFFQSDYTNFHSHHKWTRVVSFPTSSPMLICCLFDRSHSVKSEEISHYCLICISLTFRDYILSHVCWQFACFLWKKMSM